MNCYYCNDKCFKIAGWEQCILCNVSFGKNNNKDELHIKWERYIGDDKWAINIYPERNLTILSGYFPHKPNMYDEILINETLKVNKDNIIQKIKIVLIFQ